MGLWANIFARFFKPNPRNTLIYNNNFYKMRLTMDVCEDYTIISTVLVVTFIVCGDLLLPFIVLQIGSALESYN